LQTVYDILRENLEKQAKNIDWGEIGTEQSPALIRCQVKHGEVVEMSLEWPAGCRKSFKVVKN